MLRFSVFCFRFSVIAKKAISETRLSETGNAELFLVFCFWFSVFGDCGRCSRHKKQDARNRKHRLFFALFGSAIFGFPVLEALTNRNTENGKQKTEN